MRSGKDETAPAAEAEAKEKKEKEEEEDVEKGKEDGEKANGGAAAAGGGDEADAPLRPVPYFHLFRYATATERALVGAGLALAVLSGCLGPPGIIMLYGEFTTLLVERSMANASSPSTTLLRLFGGGRRLANGSWEERRAALLEDSSAFGLATLLLAVVQFALCVACIACLNGAARAQVGRVRRLFLRAVLRQEMAWFDTRDPGAFAGRLTEDMDKLQDGIGEKLGMFVHLVASFVAGVVMSLLHGWQLTLVVLACAPVIIAATALVARVQSSLAAREQAAYGAAGAAAEEALSAIRTVAAFGGQEKEAQRYAALLQPTDRMGVRRALFSGIGGGLMWFIIYSSYSLAFWYGVELIMEDRAAGTGEYTPAVLIIVFFGVLVGAMNMGFASPYLEAFAVARGAAAGVFALLERQPRMAAPAGGGRTPERAPRGDLELRAVHFRYPARPHAPVLRGLQLRVRRGETVALVGASGCGKSTVVQLLQRLYDPQRGQVLLDGEDVRELDAAWLRAHVGVVGQEPVLFAVSIAENIRYGREDATQAQIEAAAREAGAHDFIARLPQGYATVVGERGAQLSGGQKQRVAIARALVRDPRVLLLDEATSALDAQSEASVQRALERAARGRTTLVVAHRLSTVARADRIVCLAEGRVVEQGTHAELLARRGLYHALLAAAAPGAEQEEAEPRDGALEEGEEEPPPPKEQQQEAQEEKQQGEQEGEQEGQLEEERPYDVPLSRILAMNRPEWPHVALGCVASVVVGLTLPFFSVLFGEVYKTLSLEDAEAARAETRVFAGLFVGVGLLAGGGTFAQTLLFGVAGTRLTGRLRRRAFHALLRQEAAFFDDARRGVGGLCARLAADAAAVQGATGARIASLLHSTASLLVGMLLSFYFSWKLTLVAALSVPLVFGGVFLEARLMHGQGLHEKAALEAASKRRAGGGRGRGAAPLALAGRGLRHGPRVLVPRLRAHALLRRRARRRRGPALRERHQGVGGARVRRVDAGPEPGVRAQHDQRAPVRRPPVRAARPPAAHRRGAAGRRLRGGVGARGVRGRGVRVPHAAPRARAARPAAARAAGRHGGAGGAQRLRQVHVSAAAAAPLRPAGRQSAAGRARGGVGGAGQPARAAGRRLPGARALRPLAGREHRVRRQLAPRAHGRGHRRRQGRQHPHVHRRSATGLRDAAGRPGGAAVGRAEAARGHRARPRAGPARAAAGRGHVGAGQPQREGRAEGLGRSPGGPHVHRRRTSPGNCSASRRHLRRQQRKNCGDGDTCPIVVETRIVLQDASEGRTESRFEMI